MTNVAYECPILRPTSSSLPTIYNLKVLITNWFAKRMQSCSDKARKEGWLPVVQHNTLINENAI
jgi:hypothetical protein